MDAVEMRKSLLDKVEKWMMKFSNQMVITLHEDFWRFVSDAEKQMIEEEEILFENLGIIERTIMAKE